MAVNDPLVLDITPDWPNLLSSTAEIVAQHGFVKFAHAPIVSLMEMAVKVHHDDPETFKRILEALSAKDTPPRITVHYHQPNHPQSGESVTCRNCGAVILYVESTNSWETPEWIGNGH